MIRVGAILLALALASCARAPDPYPSPNDPYAAPIKPVAEMTPAERCQNMIRLMGNNYAEPAQKAALYETARNSGCFGQPQPQTLIVR